MGGAFDVELWKRPGTRWRHNLWRWMQREYVDIQSGHHHRVRGQLHQNHPNALDSAAGASQRCCCRLVLDQMKCEGLHLDEGAHTWWCYKVAACVARRDKFASLAVYRCGLKLASLQGWS